MQNFCTSVAYIAVVIISRLISTTEVFFDLHYDPYEKSIKQYDVKIYGKYFKCILFATEPRNKSCRFSGPRVQNRIAVSTIDRVCFVFSIFCLPPLPVY